ncbi:MAG: hypothetical protein JNK61_04180 [Bacteroidia bacterium]|nr:hypothetical protein [Bacteroidia bacterium]
MEIRILLFNSNLKYLDALSALITSVQCFKLVGAFLKIDDALNRTVNLQPNVILIDNGYAPQVYINTINLLQQNLPDLKILPVINTHRGFDRHINQNIKEGVCVLTGMPPAKIVTTIVKLVLSSKNGKLKTIELTNSQQHLLAPTLLNKKEYVPTNKIKKWVMALIFKCKCANDWVAN